MKLFVDSAIPGDIQALADIGIIDGVTTNPSLVAKSGLSMEDCIRRICDIVDGPVSAEVIATDADGMINEGTKLSELHRNVVVKIPLITEGLKAVKKLTEAGIKTNVTLCFSPAQAWLAAKAGATYISPFIGRLDDIQQDGLQLISDINEIYFNSDYKTDILAASIRHPMHVVEAAKRGADVVTIPPALIHKLIKHPLTDSGLEAFLNDAKQIPSR